MNYNFDIEVSIITPAFNCIKTICETYESIKKQTFINWEWIVVEDHSTDNSFEFLCELFKSDKRVVLVRTSKNSGAAIARNVGIKIARGRYISFVDADDLWVENKLQIQIDFMKKNGFGISYTDFYLLHKNSKITKRHTKNDFTSYRKLLKRNVMGCSTVIYDTKILGKIMMPLDCEKREDLGAWLDATRNGLIAYKCIGYLSYYRISRSSVSFNKFKMIKYQYRVYSRHEKFGFIKSSWYLLLCILNRIFKRF